MALFIARRLVYLLPVLIAVSLLTFSIASLLPGDLAYTILGDQATPENVAALRADMGLDQPIWWRYLSWLGHVLQGDFGRSFRTGQTVLQAVAERMPVSIELMLLAVNTNFVAFSRWLGDPGGQVFVFFILTVAAAEAAIGLAILVVLFRNRATINVTEIDSMKG